MSLAKDTSLYALSTLLIILISTYQITYVTHHLSPEIYRNIGVFLAVYALSLPIINFSQHAVLGKIFFDDTDDYINLYISAAFYNSIIICILYCLATNLILFIFNFELSHYFIFNAALFCALFQTAQVYVKKWLQIKRKVILYLTISVSHHLLLFISIFVLFEFGTASFESRVFSQVLVTSLMFFLLAVAFKFLMLCRKQLRKDMWWLINKSLQFLPHSLISATNGNFDRILVLYFLTPSQAGIYFIYAQLSNGLFSAFQSANNALVPRIFARLSQENGRSFVRYFLALVIIFIGISTGIIYYGSQLALPYLVAPEYLGDPNAFFGLLIFQMLQVGSMFISSIFSYYLKGIQISISTFLSLTGYLFLLLNIGQTVTSVTFASALVIGATVRFTYLVFATLYYFENRNSNTQG